MPNKGQSNIFTYCVILIFNCDIIIQTTGSKTSFSIHLQIIYNFPETNAVIITKQILNKAICNNSRQQDHLVPCLCLLAHFTVWLTLLCDSRASPSQQLAGPPPVSAIVPRAGGRRAELNSMEISLILGEILLSMINYKICFIIRQKDIQEKRISMFQARM